MKQNTKKQQALKARLGEIIDEFGRAMWSANKEFIGTFTPACKHESSIQLTLKMEMIWAKYVHFCWENRNEKI